MKITLGELKTGPAGTVQEVIGEWEEGDRVATQATLSSYFINAPGQSPFWQHYALCMVHLRPIDGCPDPNFQFVGATHELLLLALDPKSNPKPIDPDGWEYLRPFNLCRQLKLPSDAVAKQIADRAASFIAAGVLWAEPPLSGMVEPWHMLLQSWVDELTKAAQ